MGNNRGNYPYANGEKNINFLIDRYEFIPYNTIEDENIKSMLNPYDLLYYSDKRDRNKILKINLIALRCYDDNIEIDNFFDYVEVVNVYNSNLIIEYEDEDDEFLFITEIMN